MSTYRTKPVTHVVQVGVVIGLCILGDSLMYSLLPLEASALGISLPLVGVLLSANRLVRLFSNTWASEVFSRMGPRRPFWAATVIGLVSTALYGIGWGFAVFLAARLLWGIAWSALRQGGYEAVWAGASSMRGRLTGLQWGLVRLGSAMSVLAGGWLYDHYGYTAAVAVITLATIPAIVVAGLLKWTPSVGRAMPSDDDDNPDTKPNAEPETELDTEPDAEPASLARILAGWKMGLSEAKLRWLVGSGFLGHLLNGVVLSTTSLYLASRLEAGGQLAQLGIGVGMLAGIMLGTRWLSDMLLGPVFGYVADQFGTANTAVITSMVLFAALLGVAWLPLVPAVASLLLVFICDGGIYVMLAAAASDTATRTSQPHAFVGVYTTGGDAGSALGPLLAFSLSGTVGLSTLYVAVGFLLVIAVFRYRQLVA
jgi:MFS family permease